MAVIQINLTLTGAAQQLYSTKRHGIREITIQNPGSQATVYIGTSSVSSTAFGYALATGTSVKIGPFSGDAPLNTNELYVYGTQSQVINALLITH